MLARAGNRDGGDRVAGTNIDGLSAEQDSAIIALVNETSIIKAADACGVNERTLRRWLNQPGFMAAYRQARRATMEQALGLTQRFLPAAIHTLAKVMTDPATPASSRVSAAAHLLRFGRESVELDELVGRIESLEEDRKDVGKRR
jgi:hypothetical protein